MADSPEKSIGDLLGSGGISQLLQNPEIAAKLPRIMEALAPVMAEMKAEKAAGTAVAHAAAPTDGAQDAPPEAAPAAQAAAASATAAPAAAPDHPQRRADAGCPARQDPARLPAASAARL